MGEMSSSIGQSRSCAANRLCLNRKLYTIGSIMEAKKKILLVEDDTTLSEVYRSRLELEGFDTIQAINGEEALSAIQEQKPDLVLLDAMMPRVDGFDVLDIIRNTPAISDTHVIMLTALSQPKDKERAERLGVDEYLVKSQVVIEDVIDRVKHHINAAADKASN